MIFLQKPGLVRDDSTSFQAVGAVLIFSLCHCHFCPPLCYRLSHYDRCSSFLVLLGLLADKLSVMEMGRKGSKRRPRAQRYERKNWMAVRVMVIDSFGLMIVWAGCFPLLSFSCSFFFLISHPLWQDANRILGMEMSNDSPWFGRCTRKHCESMLPHFGICVAAFTRKKRSSELMCTEAGNNTVTIRLSCVHSNEPLSFWRARTHRRGSRAYSRMTGVSR